MAIGTAPSNNLLSEEDVCARVHDSVLEQRLAPGTKLTEEALCAVFGVGRTTVRRAFLLLKRDNIIELQKNRGAVVASPSPEEARQVFESRMLVETALLEATIETITPYDIKRLRGHLLEEKSALEKADIARWIRLTGEFHLLLAKLAGNDIMYAFLKQLVFQTSLIVALYGPNGAGTNCSGEDHKKLVDALEQSDGQQANYLLIEHLNTIEAQLEFTPQKPLNDLQTIFAEARTA